MAEAMKEARKALKKDEVPVGAVLVAAGTVIARGHNTKESKADPTMHAEMSAIRRAARKVKSCRLANATLYVTLEPCLMCMGAVLQARIPRLVFASFDPKAGACGSVYDLSSDARLNHSVKVFSGVGDVEAGGLLKGFFRELRKRKKVAACKAAACKVAGKKAF